MQSDNADTRKLVKLIRGEEAHFGQKCVLVVIDTLARAMGGDILVENRPGVGSTFVLALVGDPE